MLSGIHTHFFPVCKKYKYCAQITHCKKPTESVCLDCDLKEIDE